MDEHNYDRLAFALSGGGGNLSLLPYSLPLYPRFLALVYFLGGRDLLLVRLLQSAIGAGSVVLLYFLGKKIAGEKAGILAGAFLALYGMAVFHEGLLVPASLALFLSLAALLCWSGDGGFARGALGGVLLGLAGLASAANLLFAALLIAGLLAKRRAGAGRAAGAVLGLGLVLVPFALATDSVSGDFILTSAHGGVNFYIGNNPESNGGYKTPLILTPSASGIVRDSIRIAEEESGRRLAPSGVSRYWLRKGSEWIGSDPHLALRRALSKLRLLVGHWEYCDVGGARIGKQETFRFLGMPLLPFLLVGPLGLAGMILSLSVPGQLRPRLVLYAYAAAHAAGTALFFFQSRARLLLLPVFCLFAADTVRAIGESWRRRRRGRAGLIVALAAACVLLSASAPWREMRSETNVLVMTAQDEAGEGRYAPALEKTARARSLNPRLEGIDLVEGGIHFLAGDRAKAEACFRRAQESDPLNPDPSLSLGFLFLAEKELEKAQAAAEAARAADPISARPDVLLARIAGERNDTEKEEAAYRRALRLDPNETEALLNLAGLTELRGDRREAERLRRRAERVKPGIVTKAEVRRQQQPR